MPKAVSREILRRITKIKKSELDSIAYGVHLHRELGRPLDDLRLRGAADRFKLAQGFARSSRIVAQLDPPDPRLVISRAYYAMYHAARAVVFLAFGGDDKEQHSELPKHLPNDFPDRASWINELSIARLERNNADYDPYASQDAQIEQTAGDVGIAARKFVSQCKRYLLTQGCRLR